MQASIVFLSLRASYCSGPLDLSASFDAPERRLCRVLLARVMPKRQRILNRELESIMCWSLAREHLTEQEAARCSVSKVNL